MIRLTALLTSAALILTSCQAADVEARAVGATPDKATDEAGLWMQAERAEEEIQRSGLLIDDPALNAYVREITCNVAPDYCAEVRVYLLESSSFNAFMMPNGTMAVFSGLMLRAENEAQLATVIGHEIGHYEENHSLERHRTMKRTAGFMLAGDLATGGLGTIAGILAFQGYSRDHEREADDIGFTRLAQAGYDGREAAKIWQALIDEREASEFRRTRKRATRSSLLDSHPAPPERAETLAARASESTGGKTAEAEYRAKIAPFLGKWLQADLRARDYGMSLYLIEQLRQSGRDLGTLLYYEGEAYRQRGEDGDLDLALGSYIAATKHADAPPETWRALGEIHRKGARPDLARPAYLTYLSKAPNAPDRALIERTLSRMDRR